MSFRIPAAVTAGPAPGPLTTSGSLAVALRRERDQVARALERAHRLDAERPQRRDRPRRRGHPLAAARNPSPSRGRRASAHSSSNFGSPHELIDRHAFERRRHEAVGDGGRAAIPEQPRQDQPLARRVHARESSRASGSGVSLLDRLRTASENRSPCDTADMMAISVPLTQPSMRCTRSPVSTSFW